MNGQELKEVRKLLKLTSQAKAAEVLGVSANLIYQYEADRMTIPLAFELACAALLDNITPPGLARVYSFKVWDITKGDFVRPPTKSTAGRIAMARGEIDWQTAEMVPMSFLDQHGRYLPPATV